MTPHLAKWRAWYRQNEKKIQEDFFAFLRFPSISTDPDYHQETCKTAVWLRDYLAASGMQVELWETSGKPVIFATHLKAGPSKPTLLIYHHYDVQPIDPLELWKTPPFEPTIVGNEVYARGACDNKGQCFYTVTALKAFLELLKDAEVNIKLFIEGEEESGGPGTYQVLKSKKEELQADHLLVVDTGLRQIDHPAVTVGVRGILAMHLECKNSKIDLHSGSHGGIALNPNRALVRALSELWDDQGRVAVPGFYEDVRPVSQQDLAQYDMCFDPNQYVDAFGVKSFAKEEGCTLIESNLLRPTLELNGISGGYAGAGFKTVIPSKTIAKISCRLVPDQDPEKLYRKIIDFLRSKLPEGMEVFSEYHHGAPAFRTSIHAPIVKIAAKAYEEVMGRPCAFMLNGASIPIIGALETASGAQAALMGMGLDTDDIHAPNEHFGLDRFELGFLLMTNILEQYT